MDCVFAQNMFYRKTLLTGRVVGYLILIIFFSVGDINTFYFNNLLYNHKEKNMS